MDNQTLDTLAKETGEIVENPQTIENISEESAERLATQANRSVNNYVYDTGSPTPGESIDSELDRVLDVDKENANDQLIKEAAILKARQESANRKLTPEEKAKRKQEVCDYLLYQAEQQYYAQHHYIMDGRTKRRTQAKISRDYDKGRYRPRNGKTLND